jgi:hypothetical protein
MDEDIHDQPSQVGAENGIVSVKGPDGVDVLLTPEAAEETSHRLLDGAVTAAGQRVLSPRQRDLASS